MARHDVQWFRLFLGIDRQDVEPTAVIPQLLFGLFLVVGLIGRSISNEQHEERKQKQNEKRKQDCAAILLNRKTKKVKMQKAKLPHSLYYKRT